jgi:hypothetical protein
MLGVGPFSWKPGHALKEIARDHLPSGNQLERCFRDTAVFANDIGFWSLPPRGRHRRPERSLDFALRSLWRTL